MSALFKTNYVSPGISTNWNIAGSISKDGEYFESLLPGPTRIQDSNTVTANGITIVVTNQYYFNSPAAFVSTGEGKGWTKVDLAALGLPGLVSGQSVVYYAGAYANTGSSYTASGAPGGNLFSFFFKNTSTQKVYDLYTQDGSQWWAGEVQFSDSKYISHEGNNNPLLTFKEGGYYGSDTFIMPMIGTNKFHWNSDGGLWAGNVYTTTDAFGENLVISGATNISPYTVGFFTTNNKIIVIESRYGGGGTGNVRPLPNGSTESNNLYYAIYDFSSEAAFEGVSGTYVVQAASGTFVNSAQDFYAIRALTTGSVAEEINKNKIFYANIIKSGNYVDFSIGLSSKGYTKILSSAGTSKRPQHIAWDNLNGELVLLMSSQEENFTLYIPGSENPELAIFNGSALSHIQISGTHNPEWSNPDTALSFGEFVVVNTPINIITTDGYSYGGGEVDYIESLLPTTVYTVPEGKQSVVTSIFVSNSDTSDITYDLAIVPSGEEISLKHYIRWDMPVASNDFDLISAKITMSAGDRIVAHPSVAGKVSFTIMGVEK